MADAYVLIGYNIRGDNLEETHPLVVYTDQAKGKAMLDQCRDHNKEKPVRATKFINWAKKHPLIEYGADTYVTFDCFDLVTIPLL